jgi:uncharacterized protein YjiS (DUF1127 family)
MSRLAAADRIYDDPVGDPRAHFVLQSASPEHPALPQGEAFSGLNSAFAQALEILRRWRHRARSRRQLGHLCELDDRLLRDIGMTRADALAEVAKPFWLSSSHRGRHDQTVFAAGHGRPAGAFGSAESSFVRKLVEAHADPAKQPIRAWLSDL